jgi:hypothetical protein
MLGGGLSMARFKVVAKADCEVVYYIDAESADAAVKQWEDIDPALGEVDEDSIGMEEFDRVCEVIELQRRK